KGKRNTGGAAGFFRGEAAGVPAAQHGAGGVLLDGGPAAGGGGQWGRLLDCSGQRDDTGYEPAALVALSVCQISHGRGLYGAVCTTAAARDAGAPGGAIPRADRADPCTACLQARGLRAAWAAAFLAVSRAAQRRGVPVRCVHALLRAERDGLRLVPAKDGERQPQLASLGDSG